MRPDTERPGALAGATEPDTKSECVVRRDYSILLPLSPVVHALAFLRRFGVTGLHAAMVHVLCGRIVLEVSSWTLHFVAYCHDPIHKHGPVIRTNREELPVSWHDRHVTATLVRVIGGSDQA